MAARITGLASLRLPLEPFGQNLLEGGICVDIPPRWRGPVVSPAGAGRGARGQGQVRFRGYFRRLRRPERKSRAVDAIDGIAEFTTDWGPLFTGHVSLRSRGRQIDPVLSGLNEEQRRAVLVHKDRTLIVAGAGTGRTHTMVAKASARETVRRGIARLIRDVQAESRGGNPFPQRGP